MSRTERADELQRRHGVLGLPLAVTYKFFDDQGNYAAVVITHNAFVAVLPLLLISSSVLGFLLQGNEALKTSILASALNEFPIIGSQLSTEAGLQGSAGAVIVGAIIAVYGALGLGQALQNAVYLAWSVPRNERRNPFKSRLWSLVLLTGAGLLVLAVATFTSLVGNVSVLGQFSDRSVAWLVDLVSLVSTTAVLALSLRWTAPARPPWRHTIPGAFFVALGWLALQRLGGLYVERVLARASDLNAVFALSLGLMAFLYIAANLVVLGIELNVVLARSLYPRALLTPFTDRVSLTDADRRAYALYAKAQRHKGFEGIDVSFRASGTGERP
ncbi:MAG: YihY/virulence factor BrkB family protein [Ornithinimicrobium sp.]